MDAMRRYDNEQSFDGFLYSCLSNKVMTEITRRNREKRKADRLSTSLDAAVGDEEEFPLNPALQAETYQETRWIPLEFLKNLLE